MWAHQPWAGRFINSRGNELADYASWCNAVEGNTTFYAIPAPATVDRWAEQAPDGFRFAFKVPRTVTHEQRLGTGAHRDVAAFLRVIEPLGGRIGPVQLQLPPSFGPESLDRLRAFVRGLPRSHGWVVELRHRAFFDGGPTHRAVDDALADAGVGRVVLDTRPLYASSADTDAAIEERRTKPRLPIVTDVMGDEPVVRVIAGDDVDVAMAGLATWTDRVLEWLAAGKRPYVFAHQPENGHSPALARRFHATVTERVPALAPLPDPIVIDPPSRTDQTSLF
jgi:uncharacterized protein YecE (DUF72 family)